MVIRSFDPKDAEETAQVIAETLRVSNSRDYPEDYIEFNVAPFRRTRCSLAQNGNSTEKRAFERLRGCSEARFFYSRGI